MKDLIKDLLDDIIEKPVSEMAVLKNIYEKIGIPDANEVAGELLFWQKSVHNPRIPLFKNMKEDKLLLSGKFMLERFKAFFEHSPPILSEIFILNENEINLNSALTKEEIIEIRIYIDEHYRVSMHSKLGGTTYF